MTEHLTEQEIELYRQREGNDPGHRQITAAHLAVCEPCLSRVLAEDSELAVNNLAEAFLPSVGEEPFHLSPAELKSYAAGSIDKADQIVCESHIEICERCDEELRRLSAFQSSERGQKSVRPWSTWEFPIPARLAAAVVIIGLLTLAALVWWQTSSRLTQQESVRKGPPETPAAVLPPGSVVKPTPQPGNESVASNPPVVASLKDNNREISLDREGKLTGLEGFDESSQKLVKAALAGEGLAKARVLEEFSSPPILFLDERTSEAAFKLIGPIGKVITQRQPAFSWRPLTGANSYVVSIFDAKFNRVAVSPPLSKTNWTVGEPLRRGQSYSWEVAGTKDGKEITAPVAPAPRAQFKILDADKLSTLSKLKQQKPASHLALGLMYARFGLVSDAEGEFRQLVKENPDSALAKNLLRTVQAWARHGTN